jgi:hypothetical protein
VSYYQGDAMRGDYYRGDYYRGDPGLFAAVGKRLRGLASAAITRYTGLKIPTFAATRPPTGTMRALVSQIPGATGPGTMIQYDHMDPPAGGGQLLPGGPRRRALHWNKAAYVTRGGGTSRWPQQLLVHPKLTEAVPNRRMNVGNARALRHALHRVGGFARLARRVMHFTHPHAKGRMVFKFRRKKKSA